MAAKQPTIRDGIVDVLVKAGRPMTSAEIVKALSKRKAFAEFPRKSIDGVLSAQGLKDRNAAIERVSRGVYQVRGGNGKPKTTRRAKAATA